MTDQEMFQLICNGDEQTLELIYKKYFSMMTRTIQNNNGDKQEAKDIYQEAIIIFWQNAVSGNLILKSKISTYIYSICINLWRKELNRKKKYKNEEYETLTSQGHEEKEKEKIIQECINKLGKTCRSILLLYYFDGMSIPSITNYIGFLNSNTTKTKKYKCKKKLDEMVKKIYTEHDFLD